MNDNWLTFPKGSLGWMIAHITECDGCREIKPSFVWKDEAVLCQDCQEEFNLNDFKDVA